jgi:hypothetical protein
MAVLVEGISVIVRKDRVEHSFENGWVGFLECIPNQTFCSDGQIARVGFLDPNATEQYIGLLQKRGLTFLVDGECEDIAVLDQQTGPTMPCKWLEFARIPFGKDDGRIAICWLFEGERLGPGMHMNSLKMDLHCPTGWVFEGSLSDSFRFKPS